MLRKSLVCFLFMAGLLMSGSVQGALAGSKDVTILGGGAGGLWAIIAEGVGESMRRGFPDYRITTEPGKDGPNQVMTNRGDVQFALASDVLTSMALEGEGPYRGRKMDKLRLVAVVNPTSAVQIYVDARTGIRSLADIKEKKYPLRINVNRAGTLIDLMAEKILGEYGVTYKDIESWGGLIHKGPAPEAVDLWDAGQMDAIIEVSQFPLSRFYDLGMKHELVMLPIDPDKAEAVNRDMGTVNLTIPGGSYAFQKEYVPTVTAQLVLVTSADQPDEVVTAMLSAMTDNIDYLRSVHANLKGLSVESMAGHTNIPMHPAAEKFYREHSSQ